MQFTEDGQIITDPDDLAAFIAPIALAAVNAGALAEQADSVPDANVTSVESRLAVYIGDALAKAHNDPVLAASGALDDLAINLASRSGGVTRRVPIR